MEGDVFMPRRSIAIASVLLFSMAFIGCAGTGTTGGTKNKEKARAFEDLGTSFIRQGNLRAALEKFLEAEKLDPENAYIKHELAQVYRDFGKYDKALEYFEQALALKPRFPEAQNNLGTLYVMLKKWDLALEHFQEAADDLLYRTPHFAYTNIGLANYFKGNYGMAIRSFKQALKHAPEYSPAYFGLGYVYEELNDLNRAIEAYKKSIFYSPDNASAFFQIGRIYLRLNRNIEARETLGRFIELVPEGTDADEARKMLRMIQP